MVLEWAMEGSLYSQICMRLNEFNQVSTEKEAADIIF